MPIVLNPEAWPVWLGEEPAEASALKALLRPFPSDEMTCWPVSARVGNVKNNDASLIEPIFPYDNNCSRHSWKEPLERVHQDQPAGEQGPHFVDWAHAFA